VQCYGVAGLTCLTPCPIEGVATYPFIEKPGRTGPFDRLLCFCLHNDHPDFLRSKDRIVTHQGGQFSTLFSPIRGSVLHADQHLNGKLKLFFLPPYSPQLNPD